MRLIDADKLPRVDSIDRRDGGREVFINSWISAMAIDNAPTVDAIPIEWINKWLKVCNEEEVQTITVMYYAWNLDEGQKRGGRK